MEAYSAAAHPYTRHLCRPIDNSQTGSIKVRGWRNHHKPNQNTLCVKNTKGPAGEREEGPVVSDEKDKGSRRLECALAVIMGT